MLQKNKATELFILIHFDILSCIGRYPLCVLYVKNLQCNLCDQGLHSDMFVLWEINDDMKFCVVG